MSPPQLFHGFSGRRLLPSRQDNPLVSVDEGMTAMKRPEAAEELANSSCSDFFTPASSHPATIVQEDSSGSYSGGLRKARFEAGYRRRIRVRGREWSS
jgi:hypothetical protein